jgi:hypothetical protein
MSLEGSSNELIMWSGDDNTSLSRGIQTGWPKMPRFALFKSKKVLPLKLYVVSCESGFVKGIFTTRPHILLPDFIYEIKSNQMTNILEK